MTLGSVGEARADKSVSTALAAPMCGMTWGWTGVRGTWDTADARFSMDRMAELDVNWTAIAYSAVQQTAQSTEIPFDTAPTVSEDEIRGAIRRAKSLGLQVCLKPVVNCADGTWRAFIGFFDWDVPGEPSWTQWFASYTSFIVAAARMAQDEGCEMLCIGCEMVRADGQELHWRALISAVRAEYDGLITYNCDKYQEDRVTWWDAVDVISASGYYPIDGWEAQLDRIETVVTAAGKPFVFLEAGCPSRTGSSARPNDWSWPGEPAADEQLDYYRAMFGAAEGRPWVRGFFLWDWPVRLYAADDALADDDYSIYAKPAADYVRDRYRSWRGVA